MTDSPAQANAREVYEFMISSHKEFFQPLDIRASLDLTSGDMAHALTILQYNGTIQYSVKDGWSLTAKLEREFKEE